MKELIPARRPDIACLFVSMTPFFDTEIQPDVEFIKLKMIEW
jgi:hypothetical protein